MYPDPTEVDPEGHQIVFENEHVRILEIKHKEGQQLPLHTHAPRVVISIGNYEMASVDPDGVESTMTREPGQAIWMDQQHHSATVAVGPSHVIEVEIKSATLPNQET